MLVNVWTPQECCQASQNITTFSSSSKLRLACEQALITSPSIWTFLHPWISFRAWVTLGEERLAGGHVHGNFSLCEKTKESKQTVAIKKNLKNFFTTRCPKHHYPIMKFTAYRSVVEINFLDEKEAISPICLICIVRVDPDQQNPTNSNLINSKPLLTWTRPDFPWILPHFFQSFANR